MGERTRFEEYMFGAATTAGGLDEAQFFATMAQAEALGRIADLLAEQVELQRKLYAKLYEEAEVVVTVAKTAADQFREGGHGDQS